MKTIHLIEDDQFFSFLIVTKLKKAGYTVTNSENGEAGWKALGEKKPDLLLLDLMLPIIDGFEILKRIRNDQTLKDLHVLVFSNIGEEKEMKRVLDMKVDDYLIKSSFTLDELVEKVQAIVPSK